MVATPSSTRTKVLPEGARSPDRGGSTWREEYFAYGRSSDRRDARNRYRFIGVERDEDTGLCMTGPRTYDPVSGRFLQGDPVVGCAAYVYCRANPVSRRDGNGYADVPVQEPILPTSDGWLDPSTILNQPGGPPDTVNLGAFGAALETKRDSIPQELTSTGNRTERGANLYADENLDGLAVGPGHMGERKARGGEVLLDQADSGDQKAVLDSVLRTPRTGEGPRTISPWRRGTFHTHPDGGGMSGPDFEGVLGKHPDGWVSIHQATNEGGPVTMVVRGPGEAVDLPRGLPSELTPEQMAFILERTSPGSAAVYAGDGLTGDLKVAEARPEGLSAGFRRRLDRNFP